MSFSDIAMSATESRLVFVFVGFGLHFLFAPPFTATGPPTLRLRQARRASHLNTKRTGH